MLTRLAASQQAGREERTRSGGWNPQALLLEVLLVLLARHVAHVGLGGAGLGLRDLAGTRGGGALPGVTVPVLAGTMASWNRYGLDFLRSVKNACSLAAFSHASSLPWHSRVHSDTA